MVDINDNDALGVPSEPPHFPSSGWDLQLPYYPAFSRDFAVSSGGQGSSAVNKNL